MRTLQVTLKNNKAIGMLNSMRELDLIDFNNEIESADSWDSLVKKIKAKSKGAKMPMSEITKEVEAVRKQIFKKGEK